MLKVKGVSKIFNAGTPHEIRALEHIDLEIKKGEFVVVIGTNGSGKSTLLNAIAGTFPVDSGTIHIGGHDVTLQPEYVRARCIGRVFQNPFLGTAPNMTIAENMVLAARRGRRRGLGWALKGDLIKDCQEKLRSLNLGLEERHQNIIGSLSGGQRQSLTLIMATWLKPDLLLLDEHTAALDPKSAERVIHLTKEIIARYELTTLMVTHSMHQAANLGERLIMMYKGRIIHDFKGAEKKRLRVDDLLDRFEEVRREGLLDVSAAELLRRMYV
jgi:putative ABC transport system ATP-binding protein